MLVLVVLQISDNIEKRGQQLFLNPIIMGKQTLFSRNNTLMYPVFTGKRAVIL